MEVVWQTGRIFFLEYIFTLVHFFHLLFHAKQEDYRTSACRGFHWLLRTDTAPRGRKRGA
jgi:hypothetical protein